MTPDENENEDADEKRSDTIIFEAIKEKKEDFMKNFNIEMVWKEMDKIKSKKEKVDANYKRLQQSLQSPKLP